MPEKRRAVRRRAGGPAPSGDGPRGPSGPAGRAPFESDVESMSIDEILRRLAASSAESSGRTSTARAARPAPGTTPRSSSRSTSARRPSAERSPSRSPARSPARAAAGGARSGTIRSARPAGGAVGSPGSPGTRGSSSPSRALARPATAPAWIPSRTARSATATAPSSARARSASPFRRARADGHDPAPGRARWRRDRGRSAGDLLVHVRVRPDPGLPPRGQRRSLRGPGAHGHRGARRQGADADPARAGQADASRPGPPPARSSSCGARASCGGDHVARVMVTVPAQLTPETAGAARGAGFLRSVMSKKPQPAQLRLDRLAFCGRCLEDACGQPLVTCAQAGDYGMGTRSSTISTRRLLARPALVELSAIGLPSPMPWASRRAAG